MPFRCLSIVGLGLMGGSLALAARARGLAESIVGVDSSPKSLESALADGVIDRGETELLQGVAGADCVVFATPVASIAKLMSAAESGISQTALITDFGSVKFRIAAVGHELFGKRFVGGHPMAGSEASGYAAARADLFEGAAWSLTAPSPSSHSDPAARVSLLVSALGADPIFLSAERHDHLVALISHLPHVISFAYSESVRQEPDSSDAEALSAGSFRDLTRIAHSSPELWSDVFSENRSEILGALDNFQSVLARLRSAVEADDRAALRSFLKSAAR